MDPLITKPSELHQIEGDTLVIGDIDLLIKSIERGDELKGWMKRLEKRLQEYNELL